jgi:3-oxoacyl-[acyl-carrier protein] reductase
VGQNHLSPSLDLTGRVAIVTGAGSPSGIGFAAAKLLCELGAQVFLSSASNRCIARAEELTALGFRAAAAPFDLTEPGSAEALVAQARAELGPISILVNNAGMTSVERPMELGETGSISQVNEVEFEATLRRNLTTSFSVTRAALEDMRAANWGRVVFVSSVTGPVMAMPGEVGYAAAKAGMVGLMRSIALDEAKNGITANAVAPGWIATDSQTDIERAQGLLTPMLRSGSALEVAAAILGFCLPAASYTSGQLLVVDGGNSIAEQRG